MKEEVSFKDIVNIDQWQKIQDHFAEVIGVTIRTVTREGDFLVMPSGLKRFCVEIVGDSSMGLASCGKCLPNSMVDLESKEKWKEGYLCHIGLHNFCIPIRAINNKSIAYMLVGPILLGQRQEPSEYQQKAEELGIELNKFIDGLIEIKLLSFSRIQSVIELLVEIACYLAQMGYQRFELERIMPGLPKAEESVYRFYIDSLLNALLDVAFNVTDAEFGSVMLFDEKTGELYIKMDRGLGKDIVKNSRLKIGEGIAGLAAKERRFLLVDDKITDERIKGRLRRPEVKSAFVAPIQVKGKIFGVLNIGTLHPSDKFSSENIETLRQLVGLVSITLAELPKT